MTDRSERSRLNQLRNVELELTVELGRRNLTATEAQAVKVGDFFAVDRVAGEALDVRINGRTFAAGEIAVLRDQMTVRLSKVLEVHDG